MGIFKRIWDSIKRNINGEVRNSENPIKELEQLIIEMKKQLEEAKVSVADVVGDERELSKKVEEQEMIVSRWNDKAKDAVKINDDNLAMKALIRRDEEKEVLKVYQKDWETQKEMLEKLTQSLRSLNDKIREAKRKKDLLVARSQAVKSQMKINRTMEGFGSSGTKLKKVQNTLEDMELKIESEMELEKQLAGEDLEAKFKKLVDTKKYRDELEELRREMS